ncbi:LysR family transcriptional regulator [Neptunomonas sp.]|uniref:LysR family transcriptional regulator n=1 Tax=Neptunomonas sp. TaxID=1971898 RepID=UPI00356A9BEE
MKNSLRHLNALRAFEAAARHSSFAKAAAELSVSHSVISQHVKNLEDWFGSELFIRYGNRIELSENGRMFLPAISTGFQTIRDACDNLLSLTHLGTVTISAEPAFASRWLRKRITEFCTEFPNIEVNIKPAWMPPKPGDNQADIIIHFEERITSTGLIKEKLFAIDAFPASSPELGNKIDLIDGIADLEAQPLIHDNGRQIWQQWYTEYEPESCNWEKGKVYSDLSLAIEAAIDGEGVILADDILCQRELQTGSLVKLDDRKTRCTWYCIAIDENTLTNSATAILQNWLLGAISEDNT